LHFLSLMLGSVLVLMLPLLVWLTPDLRIKKSLLKCNWTIRKRLPRCKMRLKKRLLAFSRRLHARIRKTRYMHKMRCLLINRRSLYLNAKGALTYTDIAGDPVLYGNLPPREISMKDVFRSGDSSKKFKIAEGQWYR